MDGDTNFSNPATSVTEGSKLREQLAQLLDSRVVSQADVARAINYTPGVISQYLKGKYPGDNSEIERKLAAYLEERASAARAEIPPAPEWIATPLSMSVVSALRHTQAMGCIGVACGMPGLGKTRAVRHYAQCGHNVWVATVSPVHSGLLATMQEVAAALGLESSYSAKILFDAIVRAVRKLGLGLIVVDEAQALCDRSMDALRAISDRTGVGLAFVGDETLLKRLKGLAQVFSRVQQVKALTCATADDVRALTDAWGVTDVKVIAALNGLSRKEGALRVVSAVLQLSKMMANAEGCPVGIGHFQRALHSIQGGA